MQISLKGIVIAKRWITVIVLAVIDKTVAEVACALSSLHSSSCSQKQLACFHSVVTGPVSEIQRTWETSIIEVLYLYKIH